MPHSVVFLGTPEFALPSLQALIDDPDCDVTLVVTQPDKPVGRKQTLTPPPVKLLAEQHGIPVAQPADINMDNPVTEPPDYLVAVAYGQIIGPQALSMARIAPVNVHPSILPRWRGASPIQNAILAGDAETGVTIQRLVEELDAGPILGQTRIPMEPHETSASLHDKLAKIGAELLVDTLNKPLDEKDQDDKNITFCKKLTREDGEVDTQSMNAEEIDRHVRALVPWPGVTCMIEEDSVKLLETSLEEVEESIPVACADGTTLHVVMLQPPGKNPMSGQAWKRGRQ